ncbi:MAG: hypothetical protein GF393_05490 [Armatimonadia bacterium]|nr:hypothetical protein [Armatimonadia bacterium]
MRILTGIALIVMTGCAFAQDAAEPTEAQQADLNRVVREWTYVLERVENARAVLGDPDALQEIVDRANAIIERAEAGDLALLEEDSGAADYPNTDVFLATQSEPLLATFVHPWTRHEPSYVPPPKAVRSEEITVLRGEHTAAAFTLSATDASHICRISVDGLDPEQFNVELRRHVYLETWYHREKSGIYDPMPKLAQSHGTWQVQVNAGEAVRLHLAIETLADARDASAAITISSHRGAEQTLALNTDVLPVAPPAESRFEHVSFLYPDLNVCVRSPEAASQDLGEHHVTMIEFPRMPPIEVTEEGELIEADFSRHDRWLDNYAPNVERMMIFWVGDIELDEEGENVLVAHSQQWRRALIEVLQAWLEHSAARGYGPERFVALIADETHSKDLDEAPDEHVQAVAETMRQVNEAIPELEIFQTLTYYSFPVDVELMAPTLDFACVAQPWPEKLSRNAPPTYNPQQAWDEEIGPTLEQRREQAGMTLGSYHVASGKSDNLLAWNYAYPLIALGKGMTGVGHWAYNVGPASTWHDWDGSGTVRLDYIFVYDGAEDHIRNHRYNPTGELVVPSIRWEALREGIQVAKLLLALRDAREAGEMEEGLAAEFDALWADIDGLEHDSERLTPEFVADIAERTRHAWTSHRRD